MSKKLTQRRRNLAKEMFAVSAAINEFGQSLLQEDSAQLGAGDLRIMEERLLGALILVRQHRHSLTMNIIAQQGQAT